MFLPHLRVIALSIVVLQGLTACSLPAPRSMPTTLIDWQQRQEYLIGIQRWEVSGRIALQAAGDAWSASLQWSQSGKAFDIRLFGPLGSEALFIDGNEYGVSLTTDKGETFTESSAEELIYRQTGWRVPVDGLRYWARGLRAPGKPTGESFDEFGRLTSLQQLGWTISYQDYRITDDLEMPRKLRLENKHFTVKLILRDWHLVTPDKRKT